MLREILLKMSKTMFHWVDFEDNYGRDIVSGFLKLKDFSNVLDLGAGEGFDLLNAKLVNDRADLYAIESWEPNINKLSSMGVEVHSGDLERMRLPFDDNSVDVIICNQVLEHTKDIFWILHEATRVMAPGGRIIIGVPNLAALHNRIILSFGLTPECIALNSAHVRGFTFNDLNGLMEVFHGYELVQRAGKGFYPFPPNLSRVLSRIFPSLSWGVFVCYEKKRDYKGQFLLAASRLVGTNYFLGSESLLREDAIKKNKLAH